MQKNNLLKNTRRLRIALALVVAFALLASLYVLDFNRIATREKTEPKSPHTTEDYMLSSLNVTALSQDPAGHMWIGTSAGLNVYDGSGYQQFFHDHSDTTALPDDYINTLHRDQLGRMWVGTQNGLARYEGGYRFRRFALPIAPASVTAITDCDGDEAAVIVSAGGRSWRIDSADRVEPWGAAVVVPEPDDYAVLADSSVLQKPRELVSAVYRDAGGNLWVGLHNAGYRVISDNVVAAIRANQNRLANATRGKDITSLERVGEHILAGTTLRLYSYDTRSGAYRDVMYRELFDSAAAGLPLPATVAEQEVNDLVGSADGRSAWVINDRQIVSVALDGGALSVLAKTPRQSDDQRLGTATRSGRSLYVSSDGGHLVRCEMGSSRVERIPVSSAWYGSDTQMTTLPDGDLLLFMRNMHVARFSPKTRRLTPITLRTDGEDWGSVSPAFVSRDSYGTVWLGTRRSGLYRLDMRQGRVERMTFVDDVHIQGLIEDRHRRLWITTLRDVICYDPSTGAVLLSSLLSSSRNNTHRQYFDLALCLGPGDDVVFGSSDGCIFLPASTGSSEASGQLSVSSIDLTTDDGEELTINDGIQDGNHYTVAHDQRALSFRFFYPNYNRSASLQYQYMLEGYDQTWREPSYKNVAYFANVQPGDYTFRVRLVTSPNLPPVDAVSIRVSVKHAPWQSLAAWLLYIVAVVAIGGYLYAFYRKVRVVRTRLQQLRAELAAVRALRKRLGESVDTSEVGDALDESDKQFMDELYALMEKRASEMDLNVAAVARDLLISQTKFTHKVRQLTGDTPGAFFRKYKLNCAARLLREGNHTVSEIAMLTGFGTAAHFSVAFKKHFGVPPSEYGK